MVSSTVFTIPKNVTSRIPRATSILCLLYAIYNVGPDMTTNSHPAGPAHRLPESQRLNKWHVFWNLTRLRKKKTHILCISLLKQWSGISTSEPTTLSYTWYIQPKTSQQKTPQNTSRPPAGLRFGLWKKHKTFEPGKTLSRTSQPGNRLFTDPWTVDVLGVNVGKQKYHALSVWVWQNL